MIESFYLRKKISPSHQLAREQASGDESSTYLRTYVRIKVATEETPGHEFENYLCGAPGQGVSMYVWGRSRVELPGPHIFA